MTSSLLFWLSLLFLCRLRLLQSILHLNATHSGAPHRGQVPYPWGEVFHFPYYESETGLLADEWVPMNYREMFRYYTVRETCVVLASNPEHCVEDTYMSVDLGDCHIYERGALRPQDTVCPNLKGNFLRHVSTKPWPQSAHVLEIVAKMKRLGARTLIFVGDSVSGQHFSETHCSLMRFGATFVRTEYFDAVMNDPNLVSNNNNNGKNSNNHANDCPNSKNDNEPYFRLHSTHISRATKESLAEMQTDIEKQIHGERGPVVFIINLGLHYNLEDDGLEQYRPEVRAFLRVFIELAKTHGHIVIFRETSAQHFPTVNGLWGAEPQEKDYTFSLREDELIDNGIHFSELIDPAIRRNHTTKTHKYAEKPRIRMCRPLRTEEELAENNWRNREMYAALDELDPQRKFVQVAKFHRVTAGRHDLHSIGNDCTHFCSSPIIWYPLWQQIHDIIAAKADRRLPFHSYQSKHLHNSANDT